MTKVHHRLLGVFFLFAGVLLATAPASAQQAKQPNIIFIMGDDIGWSNIGAYNQGIMSGRTPNLDRLASEGIRFTDYYAEASCTAGRANFITGEIPIRTGMTTVGQAGATIGMPAEAPTIATALKSMGYATGQFGKNHLGDLNQFLPTVHGFDEFYGYLYHLDAMEDPCHANYPPAAKDTVGPRNMLHTWATDVDDPTVQPRWGKIGKQKIEDAGALCPERMETVDDEILANALKFLDKSRADNKPFFLWLNPTRMHVVTHLSPKYQKMRTPENGWSIQEAGMAQLDDIVGAVMKYVKDNGLDDNTIIAFSTDNGAENFTWPDGGQHAVRRRQGNGPRGRVPRSGHDPVAGQDPGRQDRERHRVRPRLVPDVRLARRQPEHHRRSSLKGKAIGGTTYKVHLDGYDQTDMLMGKGPSKRHELFYFTEGTLSARAHRRLQVPLHRPAQRLARRDGQGRLADPRQPAPRPLRADWACTTARTTARSRTTTGLRTSSGASCTCSRRSRRRPRRSSSTRPCRRARASTSSS